MDKHDISVFLKSARIASSMTVNEVVEALQLRGIEISAKTLYGWESGHRQPDADIFVSLCSIYNVQSFSEIEKVNSMGAQKISPHEMTLLENYRALDERGRAAIDSAMERELEFIRQFKGKPAPTPEEIDDLITSLEKNRVIYGEAAAFGGKTASAQITEEQLDALEEFIRKNQVN